MPAPIEFYFDFSSPYAYLASEQIEPLAARYGRGVNFNPVLLGAVFKVSGGAPLTEQYEPKARYSKHDFERSARFAGVAFRQPSKFPIGTVNASRALLWLQQQHPALATPFVHAAFRAYFQHDQDISDATVVGRVGQDIGVEASAMLQGMQQAEVKDALKRRVDEAIAMGLFGAPTIVVDGEVFWGNDRLPQIERWLASGPF